MRNTAQYRSPLVAPGNESRRRIASCILRTLVAMMIAAGAIADAATLPTISATPASLTFAWTVGAALPAAQTVQLKGGSSSKLAFSYTVIPAAPWLIVAVPTGTTPATLTVRVNPNGLGVGLHTTGIQITAVGASNSPITVPVTLSVKNVAPNVGAVPSLVTFNYQTDQAGPVAAQNLSITTTGEPVSYTASATGVSWLKLSPTSGVAFLASPASVTLSADPTGLLPGTYTGKLTVASANAANKSVTVNVSLVVAPGTAILSSVWPPEMAIGSKDTTITLFGSDLFPGSVLHIKTTAGIDSSITPTFISTGTLLAVVPSTLLAAQDTLSITVVNQPQPPSNALTWAVTAPGPHIWTVVNGASFASPQAGPLVAPGSIISIFGSGLGPADGIQAPPTDPGNAFPLVLGTAPAATTVEFEQPAGTWVSAPLIYASDRQVTAVVPFSLVPLVLPVTSINVEVTYNGVTSTSVATTPSTVNVLATDPAIFTVDASGQGQAAVLNVDNTTGAISLNSAKNPALKGSYIQIYATGGGAQNNPLDPITNLFQEGLVLPVAVGATDTLTATGTTVTIGTDTVLADYAGAVPGSIAGLVQINAKIPDTVKAGKSVPIWITVGGVTSPSGVTIAVK